MLTDTYRKDIDGLRAIAVAAVILFHFGYLPGGYLGVDVFFVISGYLITGIINNQTKADRFSIAGFYLRRARRILPLILFINTIALATGMIVLLPDDLENLAESVIATNFFSNNILQLATTANYWDVANEYKPLLHTWSLGVEEQFYLLYPFLFMAFKKNSRWLKITLGILIAVSVLLFVFEQNPAQRFYLFQFRFFELASGGFVALAPRQIALGRKSAPVVALLLAAVLLIPTSSYHLVRTIAVVILTALLMMPGSKDGGERYLLDNRLLVETGKISFSLYMWHQLLLAFTRYFVVQTLRPQHHLILLALIIVLSLLSYRFIEQPFRNRNRVPVRNLLFILGSAFIVTSAVAFYIYARAGVLYNVPELDLTVANAERNMHAKYNDSAHDLDKDFSDSSKTQVLVVGNSFARDWVNILAESSNADWLQISYTPSLTRSAKHLARMQQAELIFYSDITRDQLEKILAITNLDTSKLRVVGTKNFGVSNGIYFNNKSTPGYCLQRTPMGDGYLTRNNLLKREWGDKYIDLISLTIDNKGTVPIFTPDCKFISADCRHLTRSGAAYLARLLQEKNLIPGGH